MRAEIALKSVFALRMIGFVIATAWVILLFASFAWTNLRWLVNEIGPVILLIMAVSIFVLRPIERQIRKKAKA